MRSAFWSRLLQNESENQHFCVHRSQRHPSQMLQPRSFGRVQRCLSCINAVAAMKKRPLSVSHRILQDAPLPRSSIFIPAAPNARTSFKDSPISHGIAEDESVYNAPIKITIDNIHEFETSALPQTGPSSGRTVACTKPGLIGPALTKLSRILRDNKVAAETRANVRVKPSAARQQLRSKRHRVRFNQGIQRLVGIVLRMRKKSY